MISIRTAFWTATLVTCTIVAPIESSKVEIPNMKAISGFLDSYVQPVVNKLSIIETKPATRKRVDEKDDITSVIKEKVKELKHVLQDEQYAIPAKDDELALEGEDTTIIEIIPQNKDKGDLRNLNDQQRALKSHMLKYKRMRRKVNRALAKESVSNNTKLMVTQMIDELMSKIVEHQCTWNTPAPTISLRGAKSLPIELALTWARIWQQLTNQYSTIKENKKTQDKASFFENFQNFVGVMIQDLKSLSQHFRVVCKVVDNTGSEAIRADPSVAPAPVVWPSEKHDEFKDPTRNQPTWHSGKTMDDKESIRTKSKETTNNEGTDITVGGAEKESCKLFVICSEELTDFMADFYKSLNDTTISTLRNYAKMLNQDYSPDELYKFKHEKGDIVELINQITEESQENVNDAFKKQVRKLKLDDNKDNELNIRALNQFVKKVILHTKNSIKKSSIENLKTLPAKLLKIVKKDVYVNLDVDLGNLERELSGRICTLFQICNGRYIVGRRTDNMPYIPNKNDIYVKVQLTLDDEVKEELTKTMGFRSLMGSNKIDDSKRYYATRSSPLLWVTRTVSPKGPYENINVQKAREFVQNLNADGPNLGNPQTNTKDFENLNPQTDNKSNGAIIIIRNPNKNFDLTPQANNKSIVIFRHPTMKSNNNEVKVQHGTTLRSTIKAKTQEQVEYTKLMPFSEKVRAEDYAGTFW